MQAGDLNFDTRQYGFGYIVSQTNCPGEAIEYEGISDGDTVVLRHNGNEIHIQSVLEVEDGLYEGQINSFSTGGINYAEVGIELKRGTNITFQVEHIFRCIRNH